jgi:hypothetical protein
MEANAIQFIFILFGYPSLLFVVSLGCNPSPKSCQERAREIEREQEIEE